MVMNEGEGLVLWRCRYRNRIEEVALGIVRLWDVMGGLKRGRKCTKIFMGIQGCDGGGAVFFVNSIEPVLAAFEVFGAGVPVFPITYSQN